MGYKVGRVLYTEEQLKARVEELGAQIRQDYRGQTIILVCVLTGAVTFFTDLARAIGPDVDVRFDFLSISSYGSSIVTTGTVRIQKDLSKDIRDIYFYVLCYSDFIEEMKECIEKREELGLGHNDVRELIVATRETEYIKKCIENQEELGLTKDDIT